MSSQEDQNLLPPHHLHQYKLGNIIEGRLSLASTSPMTALCGHFVTVPWLASFLYHLKSRGIPKVLCISTCIFPLLLEINFGKPRILCSPGNLPLLSSPYHSTHSFTIISLRTDRTNFIMPLIPFMSAHTRTPDLTAHS